MNKLRVGVFMGGKSIEKEVSFNSGRTICDHLDTSRYEITPIFQRGDGALFILPWHFLHRGKISDFQHRLESEAQKLTWDVLPQRIDFMYIATHGRYAEDGTLQGMLELLRIPYLGSKLFASALSMDKIIQKELLTMHGVIMPRGIHLSPHEIKTIDTATVVERMRAAGVSFPYIIKPFKEGSSLGIRIVFQESELHDAMLHACTIHPEKDQAILIEEMIEGMEFSCITIVDYKKNRLLPLPPTEIVPEANTHFFDYDQKYMPGRATKFTPPRCSDEIVQAIHDACIATIHALEMKTIARIDGFVTKDNKVVIVDPNTLSGMAPSSFLFRQAAEINMSHTQIINHLIETELQAYGMLDALTLQEEKESRAMQQTKIRVAVLMGGRSNEKEISLESGRNITYKLSPQKYDVIPMFLSSDMKLYKLNQSLLVRNSTKEIEDALKGTTHVLWTDLPSVADFVFIGLHGGEGENGTIQGALEMLGIPYNGSSVLTSALCMDKYKTTQFLKHRGFQVPKAVFLDHQEWSNNKQALCATIETEIGFPVIIKPHDDGCSVLVQKARTIEQLDAAVTTLFAQNKSHALIEECIGGMELTVGVMGNETPKALPPSQAVSTSDILSIEEKFLPGAGENQTPAPLPAATLRLVQDTMEKVYTALDCKGYVRIDCFYQTAEQSPTGNERVVILEINTLPGLTPATCIFHQAAEIGMRPMDFIDAIVQFGFEEHASRTKHDAIQVPIRAGITAVTRDT
jgi:D-alanine--D-alanine ligase